MSFLRRPGCKHNFMTCCAAVVSDALCQWYWVYDRDQRLSDSVSNLLVRTSADKCVYFRASLFTTPWRNIFPGLSCTEGIGRVLEWSGRWEKVESRNITKRLLHWHQKKLAWKQKRVTAHGRLEYSNFIEQCVYSVRLVIVDYLVSIEHLFDNWRVCVDLTYCDCGHGIEGSWSQPCGN